MMSDPEEILVWSARKGDHAAFEELIRRTSRFLFARLVLETGDVHRAEDLLQETLLVAYRSLEKLDDPHFFRPWLWKIAQNQLIDAARHERRRKRTPPGSGKKQELDHVMDNRPGPDQRVQHEELRTQVLGILRSLPEEYRLPLTLRYLGGADYETIGIQLGLTNGALRGLLHRGLKLLRSKMEPVLGKDLD
jgi:RNA polymerase sigma-70 factor (ECF subfamily)